MPFTAFLASASAHAAPADLGALLLHSNFWNVLFVVVVLVVLAIRFNVGASFKQAHQDRLAVLEDSEALALAAKNSLAKLQAEQASLPEEALQLKKSAEEKLFFLTQQLEQAKQQEAERLQRLLANQQEQLDKQASASVQQDFAATVIQQVQAHLKSGLTLQEHERLIDGALGQLAQASSGKGVAL